MVTSIIAVGGSLKSFVSFAPSRRWLFFASLSIYIYTQQLLFPFNINRFKFCH